MKALLSLLLYFCLCGALSAQYAAGQSYFGTNNYIEYRAGNAPIIISVPHGGTLQPATIPDRTCAECTTVRDANTIEMATAIQQAIQQSWGCEPHIVICHLHRRKLDANREIVEAAQGNAEAELAWNEYQNFLQTAKSTVLSQQMHGLLIDLHGHGHDIQRLELGYLLSGSQLRLTDAQLTAPTYTNQTSIRNLVNTNPGNYNLPEMLRGEYALGTLLEQGGYPAVPSADDPAPGVGEEYFSGGYITDFFGSIDAGALDAIQIECNFTGVRDNATNRQQFAGALAGAVRTYLLEHYFEQTSVPCSTSLAVSEITDFYAACDLSQVQLTWQTSLESGVSDYVIENSDDGHTWKVMGSVSSQNNPQGAHYQFITKDTHFQYFRLKTVDYAGTYIYSKVIESDCGNVFNFQVFPNPATSVVYWESDLDGDLRLQLYNAMGMLVREAHMEDSNHSFSIEGLPGGIYQVEILERGRIIGIERIIKIQ